MAKVISELKLNDRVVPKDKAYFVGTLIGIEKKSNQYLIGYKDGEPKFSGSWTNAGQKWLEGQVSSEKIKEYKHFYFVPADTELHSNDSGNDGLTVGDKIELYYDANNNLQAEASKQVASQTRKGQIVGFNEDGSPLIYVEADSKLVEVGMQHTNELNRNIHESFEGSLDLSRKAFINGKDGLKNGWLKQVKKGKVKKMSNNSNKPSIMETVKADGTEALYRVATNQTVKGTKAAFLKVLEKNGENSDRLKALSDMLDTEAGSVVTAMLLGVLLPHIPMVSEDERVQRLAKEFRINAFATAGNSAADALTEHLLPVLTNALATLPAENTKARIGESTKTNKEETVQPEETEQKAEAPAKTLTA
jgi:hypothetical protein